MMHHDYGLGPTIFLQQGTKVLPSPSGDPFNTLVFYGRMQPTYVLLSEDSIIAYACSNLDTPVVWC